jgi:hypothetical protein
LDGMEREKIHFSSILLLSAMACRH